MTFIVQRKISIPVYIYYTSLKRNASAIRNPTGICVYSMVYDYAT